MMRRGLVAMGLALAACAPDTPSGDSAAQAPLPDAKSAQGRTSGPLPVECALAGAQTFRRDCLLELERGEEGHILVVRHKDGGFRRFSLKDGELAAMDGSLPARQIGTGKLLEVALGEDRYRFPASIDLPQ